MWPLEVHQRGEHILQEAALLPDVLVGHVAVAVLGHEAGPSLTRTVPGLCRVFCQSRQHILLRDDALSGQHGSNDHQGEASLMGGASLTRLGLTVEFPPWVPLLSGTTLTQSMLASFLR